LDVRFGTVPEDVRERVLEINDLVRLRELLRTAIRVATVEEFVLSL
jgi:hypothetical protein